MSKGLPFVTLIFFLSSITLAYQTGTTYRLTLRNGTTLEGTVLNQSADLLIVESSGKELRLSKTELYKAVKLSAAAVERKTTATIEGKPIVPVERKSVATIDRKPVLVKSRVYDWDDLEKLPDLAFASRENEPSETQEPFRSFGGKSEELWIQQALQLGLKSRLAEEQYGESHRSCKPVAVAIKLGKQAENYSACTRAKQLLGEIEQLRAAYRAFLTEARKDSVPVAWLESHYKWARWGEGWKN
jgi:uncharacterized protein YmfQ (DUF2313 family)